MPEVSESVDVDAPPEQVWAALTDWTRQGEWILATDVRPVVGPARGVGGRLVAITGVPLAGRRVRGVAPMGITPRGPPTPGGAPPTRPGGGGAGTVRDPPPRGRP